jgi:AraC-like DNA-binding protein
LDDATRLQNLSSNRPSPGFCRISQANHSGPIASGYPDIALTAEVAGTSKRKLQRQLTKAEESYSHLVELVRYEEATKLLKQPDLKLIEIAVELGYTDAANFTRAFKRWTSMSPSEFRAVNGVGDTYCSALR